MTPTPGVTTPPTDEQRAVIFLLFPELADRVFIDWERLEFSAESQQQIANVTKALADRAAAIHARYEKVAAAYEPVIREGRTNTLYGAAVDLLVAIREVSR